VFYLYTDKQNMFEEVTTIYFKLCTYIHTERYTDSSSVHAKLYEPA
jgi:hypothetical protein